MAKDQTKRLNQGDISKDTASFDALKGVMGYNPINPLLNIGTINMLYSTMIAAQTSENQAEAALKTAKDNAISSEWEFHNAILGSKDQVRAQFGKDSNELQALGLKKASEYKRPSSKK